MERTLDHLDIDADAIDQALAAGMTFPAAWYTDPEIHRIEVEDVFRQTWQIVCFEQRVMNPGDHAVGEIGDEGREGPVHRRDDLCVAADEPAVGVPLLIEGVVGDELHPDLDEPSRQKEGLAELRPAVGLADLRRLLREIERAAEAAVGDEVVGALLEAVVLLTRVLLEEPGDAVEAAVELEPVAEPVVGHPFRRREGERLVARRIRIPLNDERIVDGPEESAVLPRHPVGGAGDAQPVGERDTPRHAGRGSLEGIEDGAGAGEVVGVGFAILVALVVRPGQRDVGAGDVVGKLVRHRADDAELVGHRRRPLHELAKLDPRGRRGDRPVGATDLGDSPRLRIPQIDVARAPLKEDEDALSLPAIGRRAGSGCGGDAPSEGIAAGAAENRERPDPEELAATNGGGGKLNRWHGAALGSGNQPPHRTSALERGSRPPRREARGVGRQLRTMVDQEFAGPRRESPIR